MCIRDKLVHGFRGVFQLRVLQSGAYWLEPGHGPVAYTHLTLPTKRIV